MADENKFNIVDLSSQPEIEQEKPADNDDTKLPAVNADDDKNVAIDADEKTNSENEAPEPEHAERVTVEIDGENEADDDKGQTQAFRDLRKHSREQQKEIKRLRKQIEEKDNQSKSGLPQLGQKPTLADHDYDEAAYESALDDWKELKYAHDTAAANAREKERQDAEAWQASIDRYRSSARALNVADFDDAEHDAFSDLDDT